MVHILRSTSLWGGGGLPDTIMPTFRGGGGKKYPKMYYVVCERSRTQVDYLSFYWLK